MYKQKPSNKGDYDTISEKMRRDLNTEYSKILKKRVPSKDDVSRVRKLRPFIKVDWVLTSNHDSWIIINNLGNTASWNCHIDFYALKNGFDVNFINSVYFEMGYKLDPLPGSSYTLLKREIINIQAGQEIIKDIDDPYYDLLPNIVPQNRQLLFFVVYDPISDPLIKSNEKYNRNVAVFIGNN